MKVGHDFSTSRGRVICLTLLAGGISNECHLLSRGSSSKGSRVAPPRKHRSAALTVVCRPAVCLVPSATVLAIMLLVVRHFTVSQSQYQLCKQTQWYLDLLIVDLFKRNPEWFTDKE